MNLKFYGDSYDLVKRFFLDEMKALGYQVAVEPFLTDAWSQEEENGYCALIGAQRTISNQSSGVLLLDPDTGVKDKRSKKHVTFEFISERANSNKIVFVFDQSFHRRKGGADEEIKEKLRRLKQLDLEAFYYNSHARVLFVSRERDILDHIRNHFLKSGIPSHRLARCTW